MMSKKVTDTNNVKKTSAMPANPKTSLHSPQSSVSFLVDMADIHSMKENLQDLLTSFRAGKLKAFGDSNTVEQMETIRNMQGTIARKHFALDAQVDYKKLEESKPGRDLHDGNMTSLLENVEELGNTIRCLNPQAAPTTPHCTTRSNRRTSPHN